MECIEYTNNGVTYVVYSDGSVRFMPPEGRVEVFPWVFVETVIEFLREKNKKVCELERNIPVKSQKEEKPIEKPIEKKIIPVNTSKKGMFIAGVTRFLQ